MPPRNDLAAALLPVWETTNRVTVYLIERLPRACWTAPLPGAPRRTIRMLAAHLHNQRCGWVNTLGGPHGIAAPRRVDKFRVTQKQLVAALGRSGAAMGRLLAFGCTTGGAIPPTRKYVWRNLPLDVGHVLAYFVAHEAHHRGQILMLARQMGMTLPEETAGGVWNWTRRGKEVRRGR
ncbi:MAG TPA: DinB family protein [Gemmatimonadales bacterium]